MKSLHKKGVNMTLFDISKYIILKFKNKKERAGKLPANDGFMRQHCYPEQPKPC